MKEISKPAAKQLPRFEKRPYGARYVPNSSVAIIVLDPHKSTAEGIPKEKLDRNGLRGHEKDGYQWIKFLGFEGEAAGTEGRQLVYRYVDRNGEVKEQSYGVGSEFPSVWNNGKSGFYHVVENRSDMPVVLVVTTVPKTIEPRS